MERLSYCAVLGLVTLALYLSVSVANAAAPLSGAGTRQICQRAIHKAEVSRNLPRNLLKAISFAESGKWDAEKEEIIAWPWTVTSSGEGHYFPTKQAAVDFVRELRRKGVRNIDVGCMQVNLYYHPDAFDSLEEAFDPEHNAHYAAQFLGKLHQDHKSWTEAIARYHSANPQHGNPYRQRVLSYWNKTRSNSAEAYRQSVIAAYKQRRAERLRIRSLKDMARAR